MKTGYSQNDEERAILRYFKDKSIEKGYLLDIGANNGIDNSNTKALIEIGWSGILIEPNPKAFDELKYNTPESSVCLNVAIIDESRMVQFHVSGDTQIGTTKEDWKHRQENAGNKFETIYVRGTTLSRALIGKCTAFDFISIDAEGWDYSILRQIMTMGLDPMLICIECSGEERQEIQNYLEPGYMVIHTTGENLIMGK